MPDPSPHFFRPAVEELTPYQPGKPIEDVQRELGLERIVKLASNEGPFPPFPAALEAMERAARELNRYPDGGVYRLHEALAARHGVAFEQIAVGAGADGCLDMLSQATLDPGDAVEAYLKAGRRVVVLRTFSKIYGLAGLRVGYAAAPADVAAAMTKTRRPFDVTSPAQAAALASMDDPLEIGQRRALNTTGLAQLERTLREHGFEPVPGAVGNFLYVEVGDEAPRLYEALLHEGVIVRPLAGFGAPRALRISVGSPEENAFFAGALGRVLART